MPVCVSVCVSAQRWVSFFLGKEQILMSDPKKKLHLEPQHFRQKQIILYNSLRSSSVKFR